MKYFSNPFHESLEALWKDSSPSFHPSEICNDSSRSKFQVEGKNGERRMKDIAAMF